MAPRPDFDVIVIGGGAAGLGTAGVLAHLGASVALVEKNELGGECLHTGCVPSKALLATAKAWHHVTSLEQFGLPAVERPTVDLGDVMARVRDVVNGIQQHETPEVLRAELVREVIFGAARFVDPHTIDVEGRRLTAAKFVLCTGSRPQIPPIEGLTDVTFRTNENVFDMDALPSHLLVIGAGPIGCEMAQAFARLGSRVTVVDVLDRILAKDDAELAAELRSILECEEIEFVLSAHVRCVRPGDDGMELQLETNEGMRTVAADELLLATGRRPAVEGLGLENAGVEYTPKGVVVDDRLRTSQSHIWALGDVNGTAPFSHMAEAQVRAVATNIAFGLPVKFDPGRVAWATFTDPELASVGLSEEEARDQGRKVRVLRFELDHTDRALAERRALGRIKVICSRWSGRVLGAQILAPGAGDLLQEWILAVHQKIRVWKISSALHVYPGWGLLSQRAADAYVREWSGSPRLQTWMRRLYRWLG